MSDTKRNPKMFRESLTVINHPKALILPADFFKKRELKEKENEKNNTVKEEYSDRIID